MSQRVLSARVLQLREASLYGELRAAFFDCEDLPERVRWLVIAKVVAGFAMAGGYLEYSCWPSAGWNEYTFKIEPAPAQPIEDDDVPNFL